MMSIMVRLLLRKMGQKCGLRRDVQYQNASIWGRLITKLCGPSRNDFILRYCRSFTLAFMRGGAIDYHSNNVQVAPDGALAKVGEQQCSDPSSITINVSNWDEAGQMLGRKQPRTARRLLN